MTQADRIIAKFGGLTATARALTVVLEQRGIGRVPVTTVQGWRRGTGMIPSRWLEPLVEAGIRCGVDISPADFFDLPDHAA